MLNIDEKISHLKKIGISEKINEIEKMYRGEPFNTKDPGYLHLIQLSKEHCVRYTELSGLIAREHDEKKIAEYSKEKSDILDILFPGHGLIFGGGDGLFVIIGMADLDGYNYLNARVHFNRSSLVHLGEYAFIASNVEFGTNKLETDEDGLSQIGSINVGKDTWVGADVKMENNTSVGERSVIGMGSNIVEHTTLQPDMISFGNPCQEYKHIADDYVTSVKKPDDVFILREEEIKYIISELKRLGIDGDFSEYTKALTMQKYNTLEPTISRIYELSHKLCSEYNSGKISIKRRKEILDILIPLHGKNLKMGNDIFIDCIGTVRVGDNVTVGNHPTLAGNILIGDNVKIGNCVTLQTTGHEIKYKGRKITTDKNGNICEISTPGFIVIYPEIILADGTKVIPDKTVMRNTKEDEIVTRDI